MNLPPEIRFEDQPPGRDYVRFWLRDIEIIQWRESPPHEIPYILGLVDIPFSPFLVGMIYDEYFTDIE